MSSVKKRIIIVEDEALIADHIEMLLSDEGYTVVAVLDNADDLFNVLSTQSVDLILLDINLQGSLDGVDIAHQVNKQYKVPIVFLTSNTDKKTIDRVKLTTPAGFIAKPYTIADLISNIEIALYRATEVIKPAITQEVSEKSIFIKDKSTLVKLMYADIAYAEAMDNYSVIFTDEKKYIVPHTLKSLAELLEPEGFVKTHRSFLVNAKKISAIHPKAVQVGTKEIPLSENFRSTIISLFKTF